MNFFKSFLWNKTEDSERMDPQLSISCLDRSVQLGTLVDARNESPIDSDLLWPEQHIRNNVVRRRINSVENDTMVGDELEKKFRFLDIESPTKLSILSHLIKLDGSAEYLDDNRSTNDDRARVVFKTSHQTVCDSLPIAKIKSMKVQRDISSETNSTATHVVTGIEYGVDVVFVFDQTTCPLGVSNHELEKKMETVVAKVLVDEIDIDQLADEERQIADCFKCTYYGDVIPNGGEPTTFNDAVVMLKSVSSLIAEQFERDGDVYGLPKKAYLYPLSSLDKDAAKYEDAIDDGTISKVENIVRMVTTTLGRVMDLEKADIAQNFPGIGQQLSDFEKFVNRFQSSIKKSLSDLVPAVRGGAIDMKNLRDAIDRFKGIVSSLDRWLDVKKREISKIGEYLRELANFPFVFNSDELEKFTKEDTSTHVVCLSLNHIVGGKDEYLAVNEEALHNNDHLSSESWINDDAIISNMQSQIRQFVEYAEANETSGTKFVVVALDTKSEPPGSMYGYFQGVRHELQFPSSPGTPRATLNAKNEIMLEWSAPEDGANTIWAYQISYRPTSADEETWQQLDTGNAETYYCVKLLEPYTEYVFKVSACTDFGLGQSSAESDPIKTGSPPSWIYTILQDCEPISKGKDDEPDWYKLPVEETILDENMLLKRVDIGKEYLGGKPTKCILTIGATGSGKSTLINSMANYLCGVKFEDKIRVQVIPKESELSQSHSQTTGITAYVFNWHPESRIPYTLVIIDTPGFGDTRGFDQDKILVRQIEAFFKTYVESIDLVAFVIPAAPAKLTAEQRYVFDSILSIFGNDIEKNIAFLITFCDGGDPPILTAIDDHKMPYDHYFEFNNSVFALKTDADVQQEGQQRRVHNKKTNKKQRDRMFWDLGYTAFDTFFEKLPTFETKSLRLTREVLQERRRLEEEIGCLSGLVTSGVNHLALMARHFDYMEEWLAKKKGSENYTKVVMVPKTEKVYFDTPSRYVTNCNVCSSTCHARCIYPMAADKDKCVAMDKDGNCKICKNHCRWDQHDHRNFVYKDYEVAETITMDEMWKMYGEANSKLSATSTILINMAKEYAGTQAKTLGAVDDILRCLKRLSKIAMRPDPLTAVDYIKLLIENTKREKKGGWMQRLAQLEQARERAATIEAMRKKGKKYNPFDQLERDIAPKIKMLEKAAAAKDASAIGWLRKFFGLKK